MVDSNDRGRLQEARREVLTVLGEDQMRGVPLVVLANKQDLPKAMTPAQVTEGLGLRSISNRFALIAVKYIWAILSNWVVHVWLPSYDRC